MGKCAPCVKLREARYTPRAAPQPRPDAWQVVWLDGSRAPSRWATKAEAGHIATKARRNGQDVIVEPVPA